MYEEQASQRLTNPYFVVSKVSEMINDDNEVVSCVTGHNGVKEITYEGKELDTFTGVKKGDIICLYGVKNVIKEWSRIANVYELAEYDFGIDEPETRLSDDRYFTAYEIYALDNNRTMTVQIGKQTENNKREYQRVVYWPAGSNVLKYGACVCTLSGRDKIALNAANLTDIREAKGYGSEKASTLFIGENNGHSPKYILIINKD